MTFIKRLLGITPKEQMPADLEDAKSRQEVAAYAAGLSQEAGGALMEIFSKIDRATQRRQINGDFWWLDMPHSRSRAEVDAVCEIRPVSQYLNRHGLIISAYSFSLDIQGAQDAPEGSYGAMLKKNHAAFQEQQEHEQRIAEEIKNGM